MDVAKRLVRPNPHASDAHGFQMGGYRPIIQISTDGFAAYPEAVDLAFGPYAKFGTVIKEYRNAQIVYTPSEMVGTKRTGVAVDDMHQPRRAAERYSAAIPEAAQSVDALFQQEAGKSGSGLCHVRGVLQLLLADPATG